MVQDFDLIVAAGGNTMALNAAVGLIHKIPNIQLGSPWGIPSRLFSVHLTSEKFDDHPNNIVFDITPNKYSPSSCSKASVSIFIHKILFYCSLEVMVLGILILSQSMKDS